MTRYAAAMGYLRARIRLSLLLRERIEVRDCLQSVARTRIGSHECNISSHRLPMLFFSTTAPEKKTQRAKHAKRPNLHCAWHFALSPLHRAGVVSLANFVTAQGTRLPRHPKIKEITNSTRNTKNRSFAIPADAAAIPPNPKTAATSAIIRNNTAQPNIASPPHGLNRIWRLQRASQLLTYWPLE